MILLDRLAYVQLKENCPFCQKVYIQIYYAQSLCPNPRMLNVECFLCEDKTYNFR